MQVTETLNEGLKRGYAITVPGSDLEAKVNAKLSEAQPEFQMKGFRKGKVPMSMMKKQFGGRLLGEAMQESIDEAMKGHFDSTGDRPAQQPDIKMTNEDWKEGDDVEVALNYERLPDVPDADYAKVKLEKLVAKVEDASIEEALSNLSKNSNNFEARKAGSKAKDGDQVIMNFIGRIDGEPFEGGAAEDYPLVLGSNSFIPGFEEQLVGAKVGDDVEANVTFPEDYSVDSLAGKAAQFSCTIVDVKAAKPAAIDDELAKKFGSEDLGSLRIQISERLASEYAGASRAIMKRKLMDALDKLVKFDLPPSMVAAEADQIAHQLWHDENPDVEGHDHDAVEPTDEHNSLAERRVRLGLLLSDLGTKNSITVTEPEMQQAMMSQAQQYPGQEREFFEFVQGNEQALQQIRAPLFEDKVVDYVLELATVTEKEVTKDQLEKAVEAISDN